MGLRLLEPVLIYLILHIAFCAEKFPLGLGDDRSVLSENFSLGGKDLPLVFCHPSFHIQRFSDFCGFFEFNFYVDGYRDNPLSDEGVDHHLIQQGGKDAAVKDILVAFEFFGGGVLAFGFSVLVEKSDFQSDFVFVSAHETIWVVGNSFHCDLFCQAFFRIWLSKVCMTLVSDSKNGVDDPTFFP